MSDELKFNLLCGVVLVLVAVLVSLSVVAYNDRGQPSRREKVDRTEARFKRENAYGLRLKGRICERSDDLSSKFCWFDVEMNTPSTGCISWKSYIYKCTTEDCTWLVEP